jgi:hypothetical protein
MINETSMLYCDVLNSTSYRFKNALLSYSIMIIKQMINEHQCYSVMYLILLATGLKMHYYHI